MLTTKLFTSGAMISTLVTMLAASTASAQFGSITRPGDDLGRHNQNIQIMLDLHEKEFNSNQGEDTVALKALIQRQYGHLPLNRMDLKRVIVQAKSLAGRAQMSLLAGQEMSMPQRIYGNPYEYHRRGIGLNRYVYESHGIEQQGVWQLKIQGNVKIGKLMIVLSERSFRPPRPPRRF